MQIYGFTDMCYRGSLASGTRGNMGIPGYSSQGTGIRGMGIQGMDIPDTGGADSSLQGTGIPDIRGSGFLDCSGSALASA
jgi:hypothetical protein